MQKTVILKSIEVQKITNVCVKLQWTIINASPASDKLRNISRSSSRCSYLDFVDSVKQTFLVFTQAQTRPKDRLCIFILFCIHTHNFTFAIPV